MTSADTSPAEPYDVVIVGAGASGGALAGRLTQYSDKRVVVLEGGAVFDSADSVPPVLLEPGVMGAANATHPHNWAYPVDVTKGKTGIFPRGRVLGGSSSINGCLFMRGTRADFDNWASLGNDLWSYEQVLPIYKRVESDRDFGGEFHGSDGPITVSRETPDRAPRFTEAFVDACHTLGFGDDPDKNAPDTHGVGPVPQNIRDGVRWGTAMGYLIPAIGRPNYSIIGNAVAHRVLFEGTRAVGVEALVDGRVQTFRGAEIVLSAGALRTPQILMLSGVGPADHLAELGIPVIADLPGVGQNMTDHTTLHAAWESDEDVPNQPDRSLLTSLLNFELDGIPFQILPFVAKTGDMLGMHGVLERPVAELAAERGTTVEAVAAQRAVFSRSLLGITLYKQESRGQVTLRSSDPNDLPRIDFNLLSAPADRRRLAQAVRVAYDLYQTPAFRRIGGAIADLGPDELGDDAALDAWIGAHVGSGHPSCTCKMGPASDRMAVVDQHLRVHGVEGLRVVDTSAFPDLTTRGPNASAMMLGDRAADFLS